MSLISSFDRRSAAALPLALAAALVGCDGSTVAPEALAQETETQLDRDAEDWFQPEADPQTLKRALGDDAVSERWIYHDLDAARRDARRTGKPILALFRCVPCGSAPTLDGALCTVGGAEASQFEREITAAGGELDALLDQFTVVRMVKMNGVNRHVFAFDRDVPHAAVFLNADGTVYGRYGTRISKDRKELVRHKLSSFQQSLKRVLELHEDAPRNEAELAGKRPAPAGPALAEELPAFEPFPAKHNPPLVSNCIHCHTVGEAELRQTILDGDLALRDLWPFPRAENLGMTIAVDHGLKLESVAPRSAAAAAGLKPGDLLLELNGQPLVSEADVQWVLHHAPDEASLPMEVRRDGETVRTTIRLAGDWRKSDGNWRASLRPARPNMRLVPDPQKRRKGIAPDETGLTVNWPTGKAAEAGLKNKDLLVAVDGRTDLLLEADFLKYIHFDRPDADSVQLTVLRRGRRMTVTLPVR
ncbi:Trx7/PDZ domain-containing (seleno)protein [Alienimonas chondri]|uniref:PDZ domain-containing protein n=1 Tax=Alienimonas chondri TaxID=2681879 RepID=A0ABX1VHD6_9PLAN|nr:Trx7/PDZ domain-containing (seleno)protein [Alienimonas chondri]NNJ27522.1 hypothetical protein [Alienimonas chondri]